MPSSPGHLCPWESVRAGGRMSLKNHPFNKQSKKKHPSREGGGYRWLQKGVSAGSFLFNLTLLHGALASASQVLSVKQPIPAPVPASSGASGSP